MDSGLKTRDLLTVNRGEVLRLRGAAQRHLGVLHGTVWITEHGVQRDAVVEGGESFRFERDGLALVQPLGGAAVLVLEAGLAPERAPEARQTPLRHRVDWTRVHRAARRLRAIAVGDVIVAAAARLHCSWLRLHAAVSQWTSGPRPARRAKWLSSARGLSDHLLRDIGLRREQIAWFGGAPRDLRRAPLAAPCAGHAAS